MTTVHNDQLCKTAFAREIPAAVTTLERWMLQGKIKPDVEVGGHKFFHVRQLQEARKLKQPDFGRK